MLRKAEGARHFLPQLKMLSRFEMCVRVVSYDLISLRLIKEQIVSLRDNKMDDLTRTARVWLLPGVYLERGYFI